MVGGEDEHTGCISCCTETNERKWIGSLQLGRICVGGVNYLILCAHSHSDFWRVADAFGLHADKQSFVSICFGGLNKNVNRLPELAFGMLINH